MSEAVQGHIEKLGLEADRRSVSHDGTAVVWRGFGQGDPLVLIHGGHGSWLHWIRNIEFLAQQRRVWVPDLPGYGDSALPSEPADLDALLRILQASLRQVVGADAPVDLVGFSFGGVVAARLAAADAGVQRLALLGPTGHGGRRREPAAMVNWRRAGDEAGLLADLRHNLQVLMLAGPADDLALAVHRHSCLNTRFRSRDVSHTRGVLLDALDRYNGPVAFLWGEADVTGVAAEIGPLLVAGRPERHWEVVPGAGHWIQYEAPQATHRFLRGWLQSPTGRPAR